VLSIEHQQMLVWASRPKREDFNVDNKELNEVIATIRKAVPDRFHNSASARHRKFYDEPRNTLETPCAEFVRSRRHNIY
jgi:hypothetical protein